TGFCGSVVLFFAALRPLPFLLPPARCYLGASGSQFLGLALGACILCDAQWGKTFSPFLLILLPAADAVRVALFRLARGASPVSADRSHLHHILADRFLGNGGTVLFYALLTALSGIPCLLG
ncbi:MAG: hypothetical protein MJ082_04205, partial [Clostridia bacterium]|nr:hypothetical protein [Clostridia bacterium]